MRQKMCQMSSDYRSCNSWKTVARIELREMLESKCMVFIHLSSFSHMQYTHWGRSLRILVHKKSSSLLWLLIMCLFRWIHEWWSTRIRMLWFLVDWNVSTTGESSVSVFTCCVMYEVIEIVSAVKKVSSYIAPQDCSKRFTLPWHTCSSKDLNFSTPEPLRSS